LRGGPFGGQAKNRLREPFEGQARYRLRPTVDRRKQVVVPLLVSHIEEEHQSVSGCLIFLSAPGSRNRLILREVAGPDAWRGVWSVAQTLGSDVASELHSIEADAIARCVGCLPGFVQCFGPGCDS